MSWVVGLVWGVAVIVAVIVLGICAYDLAWKYRRLSKDLDGLRTMRDDLVKLQAQLAVTQQRLPRRPSE